MLSLHYRAGLRQGGKIPAELTVGWAAYKQDLLPLSVKLFLERVEVGERLQDSEEDGEEESTQLSKHRQDTAQLLTVMGNSFLGLPNPVHGIPEVR